MHKQISSASGQGIHLQAWIPNLAMTVLINIKKEFLGEYPNDEEELSQFETDMDRRDRVQCTIPLNWQRFQKGHVFPLQLEMKK